MVCGLLPTSAGVTVEVQVETPAPLTVKMHAAPKLSGMAEVSEELSPTVPKGWNDGV